MTGNTALARRPVAGGEIVEHKNEIRLAEARAQVLGVVSVRKLTLDRLEPRGSSRSEAIEKRQLGKERAEVCRKLQSALPATVSTGTLRNISERSGRMNENR
jgi:hypothetical protein